MHQTDREVSELIEHQVRVKTGIHALRTIRRLVDVANAQEEKQGAVWRAAGWLLVVIVAILVLMLVPYPPEKDKVATSSDIAAVMYGETVTRQLERTGNDRFPMELRSNTADGSVVVRVAVSRDGTLQRTYIEKSSGNELLDSAVLRVVQAAAPFPQFPPTMPKDLDVIEVKKKFTFADRGS